jgi:hypothetical protein
VTLEEFRAELDWRLDLYRPDRYRVGDLSWAAPVMAWAQGVLATDRALLRAVLEEETE